METPMSMFARQTVAATRDVSRSMLPSPQPGRQVPVAGTSSHQRSPSSSKNPGSSSAYSFGRVAIHAGAGVRMQTRLKVNEPGDRYEQEADRVADQVMRMPAPAIQRTCSCGGEEEEKLQRTSTGPDVSAGMEAPGSVRNVIGRSGRQLDPATRAYMEPRFGRDFSDVRVHTDSLAAASARDVNARAYTVGRNLVFGSGEYMPGSSAGRRLIAHELTHVVQQRGGTSAVQRAPDPLEKEALQLEADILADSVYKGLESDSQDRVKEIIKLANTKPLGDAKGERNYYLKKLKVAITTPFKGTETGKAEYGCSDEAEKRNKAAVEKALEYEKENWEGLGLEDVEEDRIAKSKNMVERTGEGGKKFYVDRSDPRDIRVQIKVKLDGKKEEVESIKKLEDAIERKSAMLGTSAAYSYTLDIKFVDTTGPDVFEFTVVFCEWANSGNWASGPTTISHEVHHALGLPDRYDYIESHAHNKQMNVPMRLVWFLEQMNKAGGPRDPYSKMHTSSKQLLSEDVCAVAFDPGTDRDKCIDARKDLDPTGIPPH